MGAHLIRDFADVGMADRAVAGGKGASLGELIRAGIPVPPGFVVTTAAFERALNAVDPAGSLRREVSRLRPDDHDGIARIAAALRDRVGTAPMPPDVRAAIITRYHELAPGPLHDHDEGRTPPHRGAHAMDPGTAVAVRSSATDEDAADTSFAGLQDTYLWVRGADAVIDHVRRCWASLYNDHSVGYRLHRAHPEDGLAMGVVIQRMVDPRCAGVMFTRSPTTGDPSVVALEACWGLGSALVGGDVTPDSYVVNKVTGEIVKRVVPAKLRRHRRDPAGPGVLVEDVPEELRTRPCLTDGEIQALVRLARRAEDHYGTPQDIEWAIARDRPPEKGQEESRQEGIVLLQSRPETVWAGRAAAPVATPKHRAFDHVLDSLSGGADRGVPR